MKVLVVHGPNLNLLGQREKEIYGDETLGAIDQKIKEKGRDLGLEVTTFQSNHEGELVERIQTAPQEFDFIIINPGAFTHYSYSLRDALSAISTPAIEVHLSNIYAREDFRATSVIAPVVVGQISGFGILSYLIALEVAASWPS